LDGQSHLNDSRVEVVHANEVLLMTDKPTDGLRKKKDCSMLRAADLLKEGKAEALVSQATLAGCGDYDGTAACVGRCGSSGAGRGYADEKRRGDLIDVGANPECKPFHLGQFAIMAKFILTRSSHRTAQNRRAQQWRRGNEGTELTREAVKLIQKLDLNFVGYVEGNDFLAAKWMSRFATGSSATSFERVAKVSPRPLVVC